MAHTIAGQRIEIGYSQHTVEEVARGLWDVARWGGATSNRYNVLQHSLAVHECTRRHLIWPELHLYGLWHDTPEWVQGADIARPSKTEAQHKEEARALTWLYRSILDQHVPNNASLLKNIANFDDECALAELYCFCPPKVRDTYWPSREPNTALLEIVWNTGLLSQEQAIDQFVSATQRTLRELKNTQAPLVTT